MSARPGRPVRLARAQTLPAVRRQVAAWRARGAAVHFVPTMGALHEGHRRLIEGAAGRGRRVVVSVFVNPLQFGPAEDFSAYPRTLAADARLCAESGAELLFLPRAADIYPADFVTRVQVGQLDRHLCGPHRPGHFEGVATVVLKLLNIVQPDVLWLGQKDIQQAGIVARMIRDLDLPVRLRLHPTVREADGLAMSSRNRYLTSAERAVAPRLYEALRAARAALRAGETAPQRILAPAWAILRGQPELRVQYLEVVDADTLAPRHPPGERSVVAVAAFLGRARLIDNVIVRSARPSGR